MIDLSPNAQRMAMTLLEKRAQRIAQLEKELADLHEQHQAVCDDARQVAASSVYRLDVVKFLDMASKEQWSDEFTLAQLRLFCSYETGVRLHDNTLLCLEPS